MDKKKAFLVILFAAILAFVLVFSVLKNNNKVENTPPVEQEETVVQEEVQVSDETLDQEEVEKVEDVEKLAPAIKQVVKSAKKTNASESEAPVIQPLRVEEVSIVHEEQKQEDPGLYKEAGTNNIVVTREFKAQSRAKYLFEGFGLQKAPTK